LALIGEGTERRPGLKPSLALSGFPPWIAKVGCHPNLNGYNCAVTIEALFVRVRNPEGRYLGGEPGKLEFYDDINRATIFDFRRDRIEQQLEYIRLVQGMELKAEPVDAKEIHESCDQCGNLALAFRMFFDGERYVCEECRDTTPRGLQE
jgi:hypothetical protein